jgi:hypothetical protein
MMLAVVAAAVVVVETGRGEDDGHYQIFCFNSLFVFKL